MPINRHLGHYTEQCHSHLYQPEIDEDLGIALGVDVESAKQAMDEHPDAKAIFIVNPTYYGAITDLVSIVELARERGWLSL